MAVLTQVAQEAIQESAATTKNVSVKDKAAMFAGKPRSSSDERRSSLSMERAREASVSGKSVRDLASNFSSKQQPKEPLSPQGSARMEEVTNMTRHRHSSVTMKQYWQTKEEIEAMTVTKKEF
jgi:hypothetical protein